MDVSTGIASLRLLVEMSGLLVNERDRQKAAAIQIDFTNQVIQTQSHVLELLGSVIDQERLIPTLEQRIRDLEAAKAEKQRYVLAKLGTEREFFAYCLRPPAELLERADEVSHFVCQPCFEIGKKVVLCGSGIGSGEFCEAGNEVGHLLAFGFGGGGCNS